VEQVRFEDHLRWWQQQQQHGQLVQEGIVEQVGVEDHLQQQQQHDQVVESSRKAPWNK
jgi:hypothetical protein